MKIYLPARMDGNTVPESVYRPYQGVHPVIFTSIPGMSRAGIPFPLQNQVQIRHWLKIEAESVADPLAVRQARRIDVKGRADDEEVVDVAPIGPAIAEFPVNTDGPRLPPHEKIDAINRILIAVGVAQPPLATVGLDVDEGFQGKPGEADGAHVDKAQGCRAILQPHPDLPKSRLVYVVRAPVTCDNLLYLGIRVHPTNREPKLQVVKDTVCPAEDTAIPVQPKPCEIVAIAEIGGKDLLKRSEQPNRKIALLKRFRSRQIEISCRA